MAAEITTGEFCSSYVGIFKVPGSNGKTWTVTLDVMSAHCDCPAYNYFRGNPSDRTCKHITYVWEHGCLWNCQWRTPDHEITLKPVEIHDNRTVGTCEHCNEPTIPVRIAV